MFRSAATKIAHNSTIPALGGNNDLRPLQDLISAEKTALSSWQKLSTDVQKASEALKYWGQGEGEDLGDVLTASSVLYTQLAGAISTFASYHATVRELLKNIRTKEEELDELRKRRRAVLSKADAAEKKLNKMSPENKSLGIQTDALQRLRDEIRSLDSEIMTEEARLGDTKRSNTKQFMHLKFGGLAELSEKSTIVGEMGSLVIQEITVGITAPGERRPLYTGSQKVNMWLGEAQKNMEKVRFNTDAPITVSGPQSASVRSSEAGSYYGQGRKPSMSSMEPPTTPSNTSSFLPGLTGTGMIVEGLPTQSSGGFGGAPEIMDSEPWRQSNYPQEQHFQPPVTPTMPNAPPPGAEFASSRFSPEPPEPLSVPTPGQGPGMGLGANEFGVAEGGSPSAFSMRLPVTTSWKLADDGSNSASPSVTPVELPSNQGSSQTPTPTQTPVSAPSSRMGPGSMRGGGRFASFPVKAGTARGISLRDNPMPPLNTNINSAANARPQSPQSPSFQGAPPIASPSNNYLPPVPLNRMGSPLNRTPSSAAPPPPPGAAAPSLPSMGVGRESSLSNDEDFSFAASIANALAAEGDNSRMLEERNETPKPMEPSLNNIAVPALSPIAQRASEESPSPITFDSIERAMYPNGSAPPAVNMEDTSPVGSDEPKSPDGALSLTQSSFHPGHTRNVSDTSTEVTLSYMDTDGEPGTVTQATSTNLGGNAKPARQIRFGFYDGDVGSPLAPLTPMAYTPALPVRTPDSAYSATEGTFASQQATQPRSRMNRMTLPPPPRNEGEEEEEDYEVVSRDPHDERSINAAAIREVNRELDALSFNPSSPPYNNQSPRSPIQPRMPLAPPSPLFSGGRPPRPESPKIPSIPDRDTYIRERHRGQESGTPTDGAQSINVPPWDVVPAPMASPKPLPSPRLPPPAPLNITRHTMVSPAPSAYATPPEYPPSPSASNPALSAPPPQGARTISASAFKRPQLRAPGSIDGSSRKFLPSNPRPQPKMEQQPPPPIQWDSPSPFEHSMTPPLSSRPPPPISRSPAEPFMMPRGPQTNVVPPTQDEPLPSPYERQEFSVPQNNNTNTRLRPMSQFPGPRPPSFAMSNDSRDSYYDVMSSYEGDGATEAESRPVSYVPYDPNSSTGGYGRGQFATNLEGNYGGRAM